MSMLTVKDIAKANYGRTWTKDMLKALVLKQSLQFTADDYEEITGEVFNT